MVLRHIVLLRWNDDADSERRKAALAALQRLPEHVPQIRAFAAGADLALGGDTADAGFTADFDSVADWRAYQEHPAHRELLATHLGPLLATRSVIQFDLDTTKS